MAAKILLSRLPVGYKLWQRLGLFRHGRMDEADYAFQVFKSHASRAGLLDGLKGKTILELGPGDSAASAIIAKAYGARAVLVDSGQFVRTDVSAYRGLVDHLQAAGLSPPKVENLTTLQEMLNACDASYLAEGLSSLRQIPAASIDLIYSQAVLEHIRRAEFLDTQKECARILRRGGSCSHRIDLKDHLGGALNNLRFNEGIWESKFFVKSGFYTNRIQYSQMLKLFRQAGFQAEVIDVHRWNTLPTRRNKLAKEFSVLRDEELCVSGFDVLLR